MSGTLSASSTWTVAGMTCAHCVASVSEELAEVAGVRAVDVDLASGAVSVLSDQPLTRPQVEAAVIEAGYELR